MTTISSGTSQGEHGVDVDHKDVRICGGIERLLHEVLPVSLKGTLPVAVVVDADQDLAARWDAVAYQLTIAGYDAPKNPPADGVILTTRQPAVGVWLMPDNALPGALEDFATQLVPAEDPLWTRAVSAVGNICDGAPLHRDSQGRDPHVSRVAGGARNTAGARRDETVLSKQIPICARDSSGGSGS